MRVPVSLLLLASLALADPSGLLFLGVNADGAEEWYRVRDGATVVRVPGGDYLRRPYEGTIATAEGKPYPVASFFIDRCEVTNAQFARFLNAVADPTGLVHEDVPGLQRTAAGWLAAPGRERHPVTAATGAGALAFAEWVGGRIPSAPEWEKAAGGPEGRLYPWGDAPPDATRANFARPALRGPLPVGSFEAGRSPYGCLDMAGNVYERVLHQGRPVMIKGGSWVTAHPLNLRVLDLCMQPMEVAERSVGFRCAMTDPDPDRAPRTAAPPATLKLAKSWDAAVAEARRRRVPLFLSLQFDTCGQCDRTRAQLFRDPRFVAYCNARLVVAIGHKPGHAGEDPHPPREDDSCPLYDGLECWEHEAIFNYALPVVGRFQVSPGNFVLQPDRCEVDAGRRAMLVQERELAKWGNDVEGYLAAFERARKLMRAESEKAQK